MKELSIEEKAKAYDKALERARKLKEDPTSVFYDYSPSEGDTVADYIFPELKESEDEEIRIAILNYLKKMWGNCKDHICGIHVEDAIAWLEKQGELKSKDGYTFNSIPRLLEMIEPTDKAKAYCQKLIDSLLQEGYATDAKIVSDCLKQMNGEKIAMATMDEQKNRVEPKFHEGDWITNGDYTWKIVEVMPLDYTLQSQDGNTIVDDTISYVDEQFHSFTVKDAKDGDVLSNGKMIVIFKELEVPEYKQHIIAYAGLDADGDIQITDGTWTLGIDKAKPATKEQCGLLFTKMREAGYEWDAEKKKLIKIEQESIDDDRAGLKFKAGDWIVCKFTGLVYQIKDCIENLNNHKYGYDLTNGGYISSDVDSDYHLWTIKDAKDGDVLVSELSGTIILFKGIENNNIQFYCDYDFSEFDVPGDRFAVNNSGQHYGNIEDSKDIHPASKEQRDLLFTKMKEAGYTFDFENKKLKKIEDEPENYKQQVVSEMTDLVEDYIKQKPTWSEEDEKNWQGVIDEIKANRSSAPDYDIRVYDKFINWLKSLKQRLGGEK